jgi:hypothetical protein
MLRLVKSWALILMLLLSLMLPSESLPHLWQAMVGHLERLILLYRMLWLLNAAGGAKDQTPIVLLRYQVIQPVLEAGPWEERWVAYIYLVKHRPLGFELVILLMPGLVYLVNHLIHLQQLRSAVFLTLALFSQSTRLCRGIGDSLRLMPGYEMQDLLRLARRFFVS